MNLNKNYSADFYFFTNDINETISKNIVKFNNIALIYQDSNFKTEKLAKIKKFCNQRNIKFYIIDNFTAAIKFKLDGVVLSNNNNRIRYFNNPLNIKINFEIIGKAHNQKEFFFKSKQNCNKIILSPIFKNNKYTVNNILNVHKFNLLSLNWNKKIIALGGINASNLRKICLTKSSAAGFISFIKDPKIKKPVYF
jgi:thiamine-phosphate pyrophosphorylase